MDAVQECLAFINDFLKALFGGGRLLFLQFQFGILYVTFVTCYIVEYHNMSMASSEQIVSSSIEHDMIYFS